MTHSVTMTLDQRCRLSLVAWFLAAVCALGLLFAASAAVSSQSQDIQTHDFNYSSHNNTAA